MANPRRPPPLGRILGRSQATLLAQHRSPVALQTVDKDRLVSNWLIVRVKCRHQRTGKSERAAKVVGIDVADLDFAETSAKLDRVSSFAHCEKILQFPIPARVDYVTDLRAAADECATDV